MQAFINIHLPKLIVTKVCSTRSAEDASVELKLAWSEVQRLQLSTTPMRMLKTSTFHVFLPLCSAPRSCQDGECVCALYLEASTFPPQIYGL